MTDTSQSALKRLIFCYSDASNVCILSFLAAIQIAQDGVGAFSCIANIERLKKKQAKLASFDMKD